MKTLITDGARGIGRAVALDCAARGWPVAFGYRADRAAADQTLQQLVTEAGGQAHAFAADVANANDVARLFDQAEAALGGLDAQARFRRRWFGCGRTGRAMPMAH